tara:strand:- start:745 stop:1290 length:546 start_codon:yes stop_codon:yes gene_type:complete
MTIEHRRLDGHFTTNNRKLVGHAARFGVSARINREFTESIAAGAFRRSLTNGTDVLGVIDHDVTRLLGRTKSGTLRLREDDVGLAFEVDVPDTQQGRDILALAERGDLGGMSFSFRVPTGGERWNASRTERTLTDIDLLEISVVSSWPAYEGTSVTARAATLTDRTALARRAVALKLRGRT